MGSMKFGNYIETAKCLNDFKALKHIYVDWTINTVFFNVEKKRSIK